MSELNLIIFIIFIYLFYVTCKLSTSRILQVINVDVGEYKKPLVLCTTFKMVASTHTKTNRRFPHIALLNFSYEHLAKFKILTLILF